MKMNMKLNNKGIGFILIYTVIFVISMSMLMVILNKFRIVTERATLFQAADSAARKVAFEVYKNSHESLEIDGEFTSNPSENMEVAKKRLSELGVFNGNFCLDNVEFDTKQAKVVVTCTYHYNADYWYFTTHGLVRKDYNTPLTIKGIAYLKSIEYKE